MRYLVAGLALFVAMMFVGGGAQAQKEPKYTIKEVMKIAMKGGLCKKVVSGKASDAEKKKLAEVFAALAANKCPKGDAADWKERTGAIAAAAKKIAAGDKKAAKKLRKLVNCSACHKLHK